MDFQNFYPIYVFKDKESTADIPTELPCLSDLENPSQLPVRKVLMIILSYKLLKFSENSCFRGQEIHCCYFYRAILFNRLLPYVPILGTWLQKFFSEWFLNWGKNALNFLMKEEKTFRKTIILSS